VWEYFVVPEAGKWKLRLEGVDYSPYETLEDAIEAAVEAAHAAGKSGFAATVLVQNGSGKWVAVWTYGLDPYPLGGLGAHLSMDPQLHGGGDRVEQGSS
jgi:hypothetical protein